MSLKEITETALVILTSLGGGGAIVLGLSGYLGKRWADSALAEQHQEYAKLNLAFTNQLDMATRRLQIELDALGLVHRLRTQEEFTRLAGLWKRIANVRNYFGILAAQGITVTYLDPELRRQSAMETRRQFETWLNDALQFMEEERLFIPAQIADTATEALLEALRQRFNIVNYQQFIDTDAKLAAEYTKNSTENFERFNAVTKKLESLMREHISGQMVTAVQNPTGGGN